VPLPNETTIHYGDLVMFVGKDRRTFLRTISAGTRFECHLGFIEHDALAGVPYGAQVQTNIGHKMFVTVPNIDDVIRHLQREGQIIFPKDLGYIALKLGIRPGMHVIEAGTGSGALTVTLALLVGEAGHVYTYERRARMHERAIANVRRLGLLDRVTFHLRDIGEGFEERDAQALFLDVREPEDYLPQAREALRGGGFFGAIVPTVNQVITLADHLYRGAWYMLEIEELIRRAYKTIPERIRPDDQMIGHTGFLVFARAVERTPDETPDKNGDDSGDDNGDDNSDDNGDIE
jgi:tRNA (adenine57-N1/adenine58-N1)-methyltransferase